AEQAPDQRRLAAAVRADDAMNAAGLDVEVDTVQDPRAGELQPDLAERDRRAAHDGQLPSATERIASTSVSRVSRISRSKRSAVCSPADLCDIDFNQTLASFQIGFARVFCLYFSAYNSLTSVALVLSVVAAIRH